MSDSIPRTAGLSNRIAKVRRMTPQEMQDEGWDGDPPIVLELADGAKLYPSADYEGNGPGVFFGIDKDGKHFAI